MSDLDAGATGGFLDVPGARLRYQVVGSGPTLLMIPGSPADSYDFVSIAPLLADRYTVVTYDWRGFSGSRLAGPPADTSIRLHADDAHRLLAAVGGGPAYVFASSAGGLVGLNLIADHPGQVRVLVAHEPPAIELLAGTDHRFGVGREAYEIYQQQGVVPAMQAFAAGLGFGGPPPATWDEPSPAMRETMARMQEKIARQMKNADFFLAHVVRSVYHALPDLAVLADVSSGVVVAVGDDSGGQLAHDTGLALAERLGVVAETFPGGHAGFLTHPTAFADKLHQILQ
ncbi:alpha/beta fold hydrolase [Streptosporangium sp. KLBMP 9127]|nr:alpha/beta hydrolase [Streptosporangium sp. KLBMP 9127]